MKLIKRIVCLILPCVLSIYSCTTEDFKETDDVTNSLTEDNDENNGEDDEENTDGENVDENINDDEKETYNVFKISSAKDIELLSNVSAGDTIEWMNGEYIDETVILDFNGEEDKNIVLKAENPGNVSFTGESSMEIRGKNITVTGFKWIDPKPKGENLLKFAAGSYKCKIENCLIDGSGNELDNTKNCKWVSIYNTSVNFYR